MSNQRKLSVTGAVTSVLDVTAAIALTLLAFACFWGGAGDLFMGINNAGTDLAIGLAVMCGIHAALLLAGILWSARWLAAARLVTALGLAFLCLPALLLPDLRAIPYWVAFTVLLASAVTAISAFVGLLLTSTSSHPTSFPDSHSDNPDLPEAIRRSLR